MDATVHQFMHWIHTLDVWVKSSNSNSRTFAVCVVWNGWVSDHVPNVGVSSGCWTMQHSTQGVSIRGRSAALIPKTVPAQFQQSWNWNGCTDLLVWVYECVWGPAGSSVFLWFSFGPTWGFEERRGLAQQTLQLRSRRRLVRLSALRCREAADL